MDEEGGRTNRDSTFVANAATAVSFQLVKSEHDLANIEDISCFHPEFAHQVFGQSETIYGFRNLDVKFLHCASTLDCSLTINFDEKLENLAPNDPKPDNVGALIEEYLPEHSKQTLTTDRFREAAEKQKSFQPYGELVHSFTVQKEGTSKTFEIYRIEEYPLSEPCKIHLERAQFFALWFIDAANYLDLDDSRFVHFVVYEKLKVDSTVYRGFVGYASVYQYYAFPDKIRPRIAQIMVLPPFQRMGVGLNLLQTVYRHYFRMGKVLDITAEDPSDEFIYLRDYLDCYNCMSLEEFSESNLRNGFSDQMEKCAREKLKIGKKQARRVYEILRLKATDTSNEQAYKAYRLDVKKRLFAPFHKRGSDYQRLRVALTEDEFKATMAGMSVQERHENLETQFRMQIEEYRKVLNKLASAPEKNFLPLYPSAAVNGHA